MNKKIIVLKVVVFLMAVILLQGCATLFAPDTYAIRMDSYPAGANVYINGKVIVMTTPLTVNLKPTDKTLTVEFRKEGIQRTTTTLNTKINTTYIVLDVVFGAIPIVVDAITGAWYEFDRDYITVDLGTPIQTPNKNNQQK